VQKVCELNVRYQIETMVRLSDILDDMTQSKEIGIVGAVYDISNGRVKFLEDTFIM
jgi:carbonic anhydrase